MDMQLSYQMTAPNGDILNVYNEKTSGRTVSRYVGPFETVSDARAYGDAFVEGYGVVYFPRVEIVTIDDKIYAYTSRSTSSD